MVITKIRLSWQICSTPLQTIFTIKIWKRVQNIVRYNISHLKLDMRLSSLVTNLKVVYGVNEV